MMSESCCTLYIAAASPASTGDAPDLKLMTGKTDGKTDGKAGRVRLDLAWLQHAPLLYFSKATATG